MVWRAGGGTGSVHSAVVATVVGACLLLSGCGSQTREQAASSPGAPSVSAAPTGPLSGHSCTSTAVPFPKTLAEGGSLTLEPDQWNAEGEVCLEFSGDNGFTVSTVRNMLPAKVGAPGAYPNVATSPGALGLPVPVAALGDATADWQAETGGVSGSYDLAFDLWYGPSQEDCVPAHSAELMVWLDATENVQPAGGAPAAQVALDGVGYNVHLVPRTTAHTVISYVRLQPTHSVHDLDLRLFTQDAVMRGYVPSGSFLCKVSAGFEIWTGGKGLRSTDFGFHNAVGLPAGRVRDSRTGNCLSASPTGVHAAACSGSSSWTSANDGTLQTGNRCLAAGGSLVLESCTGAALSARWGFDSSGRLANAATGRCLGSAATLVPCTSPEAGRWALPTNASD
ncbi:GH12 family glycosyl hydrolase domain-containing protein [Streptacidiphilus monticola]|uniref:Ricin-type beta-trefoil lectin domain protein n=1 Tax=Streptacidiphilus monticola TaxID=2161674 RepID=A0ABW1G7Z1_9ACTN